MFCIAPSPASTPKALLPFCTPCSLASHRQHCQNLQGEVTVLQCHLADGTHSDIKGWLVCYTAKPPTMKQIKKSNFEKEKE